MLKFFRRIRQKLISQGNVKRYLLYAIGEVVLVMIGILLALQVNNWNQKRQQVKKINSYLENLKQDLRNDISSMESCEDENLFRFYSMQYLLMISGIEMFDAAIDEITVPDWPKGNFIWQNDIPTRYDSTFIQRAFLWTH